MLKLSFLSILAAGCVLAGTAFAQEASVPVPASVIEAAPPSALLISSVVPASVEKQIKSDSELDSLAGGRATNTAIALTEQDLTAVNSGNTITAGVVGSGAITLSGNAFSDFNGVGNIIMNTGHNNNLQSSMSVTVIITP